MTDAAFPFVTIGIPCLNEEKFIAAVVERVLEMDYPPDRMEVLVADGGSTDRTLDILRELERRDVRLLTIPNPARIQAAGMNEIVRRARGEIVIRLDAHADYARDYVRRCVEVLRETGADNVGGAARARAQNGFQRALCAALDSPLGVGGSKYRDADNEGYVESVFNGAFRRSVFERAGLYDPGAITNEDAELNQRILAAGGRIYLSRKIVAYYYPRDSLSGLARQYFKYGKGRARTLLKHRELPSWRPLVPFAFVVGGAALLLSGRRRLTAAVFTTYALGAAFEAVRVGRRVGWWAPPVVAVIFPVLHVAHGVGMAVGLQHYVRHPDWHPPERLDPTTSTAAEAPVRPPRPPPPGSAPPACDTTPV